MMAKNYFTYEQIRAVILKKLEANGVDTTEAINIPSEEAIAHLKEFANLAVEVAIGEVVAYKFEYLFEQATEKGELDVWTEAVSRSYPKDMNGNHPVRNVSPLYLIQELDN